MRRVGFWDASGPRGPHDGSEAPCLRERSSGTTRRRASALSPRTRAMTSSSMCRPCRQALRPSSRAARWSSGSSMASAASRRCPSRSWPPPRPWSRRDARTPMTWPPSSKTSSSCSTESPTSCVVASTRRMRDPRRSPLYCARWPTTSTSRWRA